MSRQGVTPDEVAIAAQGLAAADKPVTIKAVRDCLGAGSFTTIACHLAQWRAQFKVVAAEAMALPPEVEVAAHKAIAAIWQSAMAIARRETEAIRQSSCARIDEAKAQAEEALQEIARLEAHIDGARQQIGHRVDEIDDLRRRLIQSEANAAAKLSRAEQLDARVVEIKAELAEARAAIEQKTDECGRLRGELAAFAAGSIGRNAPQLMAFPAATA